MVLRLSSERKQNANVYVAFRVINSRGGKHTRGGSQDLRENRYFCELNCWCSVTRSQVSRLPCVCLWYSAVRNRCRRNKLRSSYLRSPLRCLHLNTLTGVFRMNDMWRPA